MVMWVFPLNTRRLAYLFLESETDVLLVNAHMSGFRNVRSGERSMVICRCARWEGEGGAGKLVPRLEGLDTRTARAQRLGVWVTREAGNYMVNGPDDAGVLRAAHSSYLCRVSVLSIFHAIVPGNTFLVVCSFVPRYTTWLRGGGGGNLITFPINSSKDKKCIKKTPEHGMVWERMERLGGNVSSVSEKVAEAGRESRDGGATEEGERRKGRMRKKQEGPRLMKRPRGGFA